MHDLLLLLVLLRAFAFLCIFCVLHRYSSEEIYRRKQNVILFTLLPLTGLQFILPQCHFSVVGGWVWKWNVVTFLVRGKVSMDVPLTNMKLAWNYSAIIPHSGEAKGIFPANSQTRMKFSGLVNIIIRNIFQPGGKQIFDWVWLILANMSESAKNAISQKLLVARSRLIALFKQINSFLIVFDIICRSKIYQNGLNE